MTEGGWAPEPKEVLGGGTVRGRFVLCCFRAAASWTSSSESKPSSPVGCRTGSGEKRGGEVEGETGGGRIVLIHQIQRNGARHPGCFLSVCVYSGVGRVAKGGISGARWLGGVSGIICRGGHAE